MLGGRCVVERLLLLVIFFFVFMKSADYSKILILVSHMRYYWGGGTHIGRWYKDVPPSRPPFSGHFLALEIHLSKSFSSSRDPTSIFLKKNLAFQDHFLPILPKMLAPETQILAKIHSGDPIFRPKTKFWRPYFCHPKFC